MKRQRSLFIISCLSLCAAAPSGCHSTGYRDPITALPTIADVPGTADDQPYGPWHRVTDGEIGEDLFPAPLPDGSGVVFASNRHSEYFKLYFQAEPAGHVVRQITHGPGHDVHPAVAPDGVRVAFASNRTGDWRLYVAAHLEDRSPKRLSDEEVAEIHPRWSPDGRSLVYSRLSPVSGQWEVWIRDLEGAARRITEGLFPEIHPDGDRVVFQRPRRRGDMWYSIWTVALDGTRETEIVSGQHHGVTHPSWSADGQWIVYSTASGDGFEAGARGTPPGGSGARTVGRDEAGTTRGRDLYMIRVDGLHERRLTFQDAPEWGPVWARDGWVYFCAEEGGTTALWRLRP
ncbi:MAG: TolB family protein [Planctomycetota bacterium]